MQPQLLLSSQHRVAQDRLGAALAEFILANWRRTYKGPVAGSITDEWIATMLPTILAYRERSAATSQVFYQRSRLLVDERPFSGGESDPVEEEAIATSLLVTGPIGLSEKLGKNMPLEKALTQAGKAASGAAARHALDGGRSYTKNAVLEDQLALGSFRQAREGCCSFCAMLASRGAVYKGDSFDASDPRFEGDGDAKVHDHCHCTLQQVYSRGDALPSLNATFSDLWESSTKGYRGKGALNAFRNAYEANYGRSS